MLTLLTFFQHLCFYFVSNQCFKIFPLLFYKTLWTFLPKTIFFNSSKLIEFYLKISTLRSFHRFAVRSSSAHEGKIIIFERFQCSLTKTI